MDWNIKNLIEKIDSELKQYLINEKNNSDLLETNEIFDLIIDSVFPSGKRLRPLFCIGAFFQFKNEYSKEDLENIIKLSSALELLHTFALIHDDIMDDSNTRRGEPTLHIRANSKSVGILAGDIILVIADKMFFEAARFYSNDIFINLINYYNKTRLDLCLGQYLDILEETTKSSTSQKLNLMRLYKSGKYTIENPIHIGMIATGLDVEKDQEIFEQASMFALPLGNAFQIRDDMLSMFGDSNKTGKPVGDDARSGKKTLFWEFLFINNENSNDEKIKLAKKMYGNKELSDKDIKDLQELLKEIKAYDFVENTIIDNYESSKKISDEYNYHSSLKELAYYCAYR